jgi:hypothetical protein
LWVQPTQVSAQALTDRLGSLPATLFHQVFHDLLPQLHQRWQARHRPLSRVGMEKSKRDSASGIIVVFSTQ